MPIFYTQDIHPYIKLGIWKITETEEFFLEKAPLARQVTHPHKRLQHLAGRYLLSYLFPEFPYADILIANTRKPYLPREQFHFSISHCGNYAAAIISKQQRVGIDIEIFSPKTEKVKNKFLSSEELTAADEFTSLQMNLSEHPSNKLFTLLWCCKEAVYKWWGHGGIDFKKDIHILCQQEKEQIQVAFLKEKIEQLIIHYHLFDELCLAWTNS